MSVFLRGGPWFEGGLLSSMHIWRILDLGMYQYCALGSWYKCKLIMLFRFEARF